MRAAEESLESARAQHHERLEAHTRLAERQQALAQAGMLQLAFCALLAAGILLSR